MKNERKYQKPMSYYRNMNLEKARQIRAMYFDQRIKQKDIAELFGIKQHSVSRIISNLSWSE